MTKQDLRYRETYEYLSHNDTDLGYRRLLDIVADTQDMQLYREAITLTDWKEINPQDNLGLINKAKDLLDKTGGIALNPQELLQPVVTANEVFKQYKGGNFSLGPISIEIKKGQVYGLVGENGNGKTTLLRILAKELRIDRGHLQYTFRVTPKDDFDLRTKLVYIPQRTERWYGSLKDNLKFVLSNYNIPATENETRVELMIARFGLWKYRHLKWDELSSGYKMRFELARTMLRKPELLLLDEPLANLDVLAQQIILEDLKSIANSITNPIALILSSQQLYEVEKVSDKVIYLKNGKYTGDKTVASGTETPAGLIVEIDSTESREKLQLAFATLGLEKLTYNGGVYVAYFNTGVSFAQVLAALGQNQVQVTYIRDITHSTRKYFVV